MSNAILIFIAAGYIGYLLGAAKGYAQGADRALAFLMQEIFLALKDDEESMKKIITHLYELADKGVIKYD